MLRNSYGFEQLGWSRWIPFAVLISPFYDSAKQYQSSVSRSRLRTGGLRVKEADVDSQVFSKGRPRNISLPDDPTNDELARDWSLSNSDQDETNKCRGKEHKLRFAIQLCILRKHGRFLESYGKVPVRIINHLCKQLKLAPVLSISEPSREATEYEHQQRIREYLNYRFFDEQIEQELNSWLSERAVEGSLPEELFQRAEQVLKSWHVVLPGPSTLGRLVASVSARAKQDFFEFIAARVSKQLRQKIDQLLIAADRDGKTALFHLKEYPPAPNAKHIVAYIEHFKRVDELLGGDFDTGVDLQMQKHLAQLAKRYDASALRRFVPDKRYALAACFLSEIRKTLLDHVVDMHDQLMIGTTRKCRRKYEAKLKQERKRSKSGFATILEATELIIDCSRPTADRLPHLFSRIDEGRLRSSLISCRRLQRLEDRGYVDELCNHYSGLRRYLPKFIGLNFESAVGSERLLESIKVARKLNEGESDKLPDNTPCFFVPNAWRPALLKTDGSIDRRVWEIALALAIRDALRSGDLYLSRSRKHVSFWNLVYGETQWEQEKSTAYATLALPSESNDILCNLKAEYKEAVNASMGGLTSNTFATIINGQLHLKRPDALEVPESAQQLRRAIETNMPQIRIEDLLQQMDQRCRFLQEFRPLGGYTSRAPNLHLTLLANLIAQGTNLGIAAMANSVDGLTPDMLQHVNQWFFSEETQKAANTAMVNYHHTLPLSELFGSGDISSSDGQRFGVQRSSLLALLYPRYFGYYDRAVAVYTHISDQYSVFSTQVISCGPREALYVLDGLLNNDTKLRPREHTTDTHGYTEQLFGLCYLLGFSFMPRLKDLPDQRLYQFDRSIDVGSLKPLFHGCVDLELIREQWDQLVRTAASLKSRVAPAHIVLHRLVNASPSDRLAKALTALGQLVKSIYILRYICDPALRQRVQRQLNRGESRHDLARVLFFANRGEFRTGDYEEIMNKASCLSLLSNAVLAWNTMEMHKVIQKLRKSKQPVADEDVAFISPLMRFHVIPNGTYFHTYQQEQPSLTVWAD